MIHSTLKNKTVLVKRSEAGFIWRDDRNEQTYFTGLSKDLQPDGAVSFSEITSKDL